MGFRDLIRYDKIEEIEGGGEMTWMQGAALCAAAIVLFALGRFFPNRRIFALFCAALVISALFILSRDEPKAGPMTAAELAHTEAQQELVVEWYEEFQGCVERMDYNWRQYHRILSDFDTDTTGLEETFGRLAKLSTEARETEAVLEKMEPALALDDENYDLVTAVVMKARAYARAQRLTIEHTATAADPEKQTDEAQEAQSRRLREVMHKESPAGLFVAQEITALRENVEIKE